MATKVTRVTTRSQARAASAALPVPAGAADAPTATAPAAPASAPAATAVPATGEAATAHDDYGDGGDGGTKRPKAKGPKKSSSGDNEDITASRQNEPRARSPSLPPTTTHRPEATVSSRAGASGQEGDRSAKEGQTQNETTSQEDVIALWDLFSDRLVRAQQGLHESSQDFASAVDLARQEVEVQKSRVEATTRRAREDIVDLSRSMQEVVARMMDGASAAEAIQKVFKYQDTTVASENPLIQESASHRAPQRSVDKGKGVDRPAASRELMSEVSYDGWAQPA